MLDKISWLHMNSKIVIFGDAGVGKTSLLTKLTKDEFVMKYVPTIGVSNVSHMFNTSNGKYILNFYEYSGQEKLNNISFEREYDVAIIMYDVTSHSTYNSVSEYFNKITCQLDNIKVFVIGNKVDCKDRKVNKDNMTFSNERCSYHEISVKTSPGEGRFSDFLKVTGL